MSKEPQYDYHVEGYLHAAVHRKIFAFDPRNTTNPILREYAYAPIKDEITGRIKSIVLKDVLSYNTGMAQAIPPAYRVLIQDNTIRWSKMIESLVFNEQLFGLFYGGYSDVLDRVIHCEVQDKDSIVFREYKTGHSIFHVAAKLRILNTLGNSLHKTLGEKIQDIDAELNYILKCYKILGTTFRDGNDLTICYMEDFSGVYLIDYLSKFADDLADSSLF